MECPCENENENEQLLIELCGKYGLLIGGMVFSYRDCHKVTWVSPDKDNQVENQTDHIRISRNWSKSLLDVRNKRGSDIGSDHHMIMGILRIKIKKVKRKVTNTRKYNLKKLDDTEYQRILKVKICGIKRSRRKVGGNKGHIPRHLLKHTWVRKQQ